MPKVASDDIRKIIFDHFNDTDTRFSNDELLEYLNQIEKYKGVDEVLDLEDILLKMEKSGLLRPIAQNFNTRYYRLWNTLVQSTCKTCKSSIFLSQNEEFRACPQCGAVM